MLENETLFQQNKTPPHRANGKQESILVSIPGPQSDKTVKLGKLWGFFIFEIFYVICFGPFQLHNINRKTSTFILYPSLFCFDLVFVFEGSKIK